MGRDQGCGRSGAYTAEIRNPHSGVEAEAEVEAS